MKLSPLLSKLNQLLLGVLFYLLDCPHYLYRWLFVPISVNSMEMFFPGFRLAGAIAIEVT